MEGIDYQDYQGDHKKYKCQQMKASSKYLPNHCESNLVMINE